VRVRMSPPAMASALQIAAVRGTDCAIDRCAPATSVAEFRGERISDNLFRLDWMPAPEVAGAEPETGSCYRPIRRVSAYRCRRGGCRFADLPSLVRALDEVVPRPSLVCFRRWSP